eukprot:TRINITY_DN23999_c0_g1_i1.p1 TRINITY_DN23999_c0_g1~~TRINITY_DN23999_c0_g1_i1.p1  ORF type:complete len:457 (-),score=109.56 TRINITY_DN23999_c0_g1_i1:246-1616(-)
MFFFLMSRRPPRSTLSSSSAASDVYKRQVAHYASSLNYSTFYAGKYLNNYGSKETGGIKYIPPGWDQWYGLVGNSKYYNYTVSNNGVAEKHGGSYEQDYFTDYLTNKSVEFVEQVRGAFFIMIGTPASHIPDDYAPWTENMFNTTIAPRNENFNHCPNLDKHTMMRGIQPMSPGDPSVDGMNHMYAADWVHIKRLRTLQSVDVMIERIITAVRDKGELENTFFLLTSDNGYHLGQFGLAYDKRQLYEEDIRVPMVVRGPGIAPNTRTAAPAMHIDLAPTVLEMMGMPHTPSQMDGASWLGLVTDDPGADWRTEMLVEYQGPTFSGMSDIEYDALDPTEVDVDQAGELFDMANLTSVGGCKWFSKASSSQCDPESNTYACVRSIKSAIDANSVYCEFTKEENFVEYYDIDADPFQLYNLAQNATVNRTTTFTAKMKSLAARLRAHMKCSGHNCLHPE